MTSPTREQLSAIWNRPGVENPGHINIWSAEGTQPQAKPGAKRRPTWDKALLKRAKQHLPHWYSQRSKSYY